MQRILLLSLGWLAIVLGTLGIVLPLLPTTPFVLLAAWCFARSSPRFHDWLLWRSPFGRFIRHWQQHHAMPPGAKGRAILLIVITFSVSIYLVNLLWVRILLGVMLCLLLLFMRRIPVVDENDNPPQP
ncbi:DUF454 family protein [Candidatus Pantoea floridensis]|uniref:Inner membrane protein n=1 Tax=Candidatus Pantoea floridensis TaxID=1938870 RepID=A0A286BQJ5_9GAMM|nr:DUF454 family protein [Pantoea floridensis]PIF23027.1 hypothetical protein BX596_2460 [Enterobacteriaceae bacterium JKS000233]SOD36427.1 hypothetical protein SAMN06273570_0783 [Pantoea floridensis]